MALEIQTSTLQQRRQTFAHIARRFGEDRPASRYEEATLDIQPMENFYYRPTWDPQHEIYDSSRTSIVMKDWYELSDPRQFYYNTYTINRAKMSDNVEKSLDFVNRRSMLSGIDPDWQEMVRFYLLPLRHAEWGANMNACNIADVGYGAAITQSAIYAAMDRLGIAQIIGRIGMALGGPEALAAAKDVWVVSEQWQPLRRLVEDSLVIEDWFEQLVMQFLCSDGLLLPLVYDAFDAQGDAHGASGLSMVCEFMVDWKQESARWIDAVLAKAIAESDQNRNLIAGWFAAWEPRVAEALKPLAEKVLGAAGFEALADLRRTLAERAQRLGIAESDEVPA